VAGSARKQTRWVLCCAGVQILKIKKTANFETSFQNAFAAATAARGALAELQSSSKFLPPFPCLRYWADL
jgi:hypothetical protein